MNNNLDFLVISADMRGEVTGEPGIPISLASSPSRAQGSESLGRLRTTSPIHE